MSIRDLISIAATKHNITMAEVMNLEIISLTIDTDLFKADIDEDDQLTMWR